MVLRQQLVLTKISNDDGWLVVVFFVRVDNGGKMADPPAARRKDTVVEVALVTYSRTILHRLTILRHTVSFTRSAPNATSRLSEQYFELNKKHLLGKAQERLQQLQKSFQQE